MVGATTEVIARHHNLAGIACWYRTGLDTLGAEEVTLLGCGSTPLPAAVSRSLADKCSTYSSVESIRQPIFILVVVHDGMRPA